MRLILAHIPDIVSVLAQKLRCKTIRCVFLRIHGIKLNISKVFKSIRLRFIKILNCSNLNYLISLFGFLLHLVRMSTRHQLGRVLQSYLFPVLVKSAIWPGDLGNFSCHLHLLGFQILIQTFDLNQLLLSLSRLSNNFFPTIIACGNNIRVGSKLFTQAD